MTSSIGNALWFLTYIISFNIIFSLLSKTKLSTACKIIDVIEQSIANILTSYFCISLFSPVFSLILLIIAFFASSFFSSILFSIFFILFISSFSWIFTLFKSSITLKIGDPSCPIFVLLPTYINIFSFSIYLKYDLTPIISYSFTSVLKDDKKFLELFILEYPYIYPVLSSFSSYLHNPKYPPFFPISSPRTQRA